MPAVRRKRFWSREISGIVPNAEGVAVDLMTDFRTQLGVASNPPGLTVGGTMLDLMLTQTGGRAAPGDGVVIGLLVTSETEAGEVERPISDPHADWLWYQYLASPGAAEGSSWSTFQAMGGPIRIRAKRRMDEIGMHYWLVAQTSGVTPFDLAISSSTLLLMP